VIGQGWKITGKGFIHGDELTSQAGPDAQGFVAMWFDPSMDETYSAGLHLAIEDAGYKPLRLDNKEYINKIDDEIIAEIRRSRFLVADFTGHRGGVYFEAGFATGLGRPVFWTCKHSEIQELHFDIRQYNCIDWGTVDELRLRLGKRIAALLGDGPYQQPQQG
jgi:hypothetical protein